MNEVIITNDNSIQIKDTVLSYDKKIRLFRAFQHDMLVHKKYLISTALLVGNEIVTSNHIDTMHFFEELNLFEFGNDQNRYFSVEQHNNIKNLKLNNTNIYISKSEARTMYKVYNQCFLGYSMTRLLEAEYRFTPELVATLIFHDNYFDIEPQGLLQ